MNDVPPSREPSDDDIDTLYRRASALDPSRPSGGVSRAILAHAAQVSADRAPQRDPARTKVTPARTRRAWWRPAVFGTLAAAVLAGLFVLPNVRTSYLAPQPYPRAALPKAASTPPEPSLNTAQSAPATAPTSPAVAPAAAPTSPAVAPSSAQASPDQATSARAAESSAAAPPPRADARFTRSVAPPRAPAVPPASPAPAAPAPAPPAAAGSLASASSAATVSPAASTPLAQAVATSPRTPVPLAQPEAAAPRTPAPFARSVAPPPALAVPPASPAPAAPATTAELRDNRSRTKALASAAAGQLATPTDTAKAAPKAKASRKPTANEPATNSQQLAAANAKDLQPPLVDITVTAQRRTQNDMATPSPISSIAADSLSTTAVAPPDILFTSPARLRLAAERGDLKTLQAALDQLTDINSRDESGRTALLLATLHKKSKAVTMLLERGADPNIADANGMTPLQAATSDGKSAIIDALKRAGAH